MTAVHPSYNRDLYNGYEESDEDTASLQSEQDESEAEIAQSEQGEESEEEHQGDDEVVSPELEGGVQGPHSYESTTKGHTTGICAFIGTCIYACIFAWICAIACALICARNLYLHLHVLAFGRPSTGLTVAQEEALSKLNFIKNGKHDIDEGILVGYTQQNLLRNIGLEFMENVQSFDDTDVEDMYEILKPLVRAKEGLQPSGIPRSTQQNGHGASSFTNGHCKNPRRTNVGSQGTYTASRTEDSEHKQPQPALGP